MALKLFIRLCFVTALLGHGVSFPQIVEDLSSLMEIGVHQPVSGGCYPLGASIAPYPELVLYVEERLLNEAILSSFLQRQSKVCQSDRTCRGWVEFCAVYNTKYSCGPKIYSPLNGPVDQLNNDQFSVLSQISPPPIIHLDSAGCHSYRFEIRGSFDSEDGTTGATFLLRKSNDTLFQVTPLFECLPSPLCPSIHDVFSTEGDYQFHPIVNAELSYGFEVNKGGSVSIVSDSPKHRDVVLSNSILLEMSRRDGNGQQRSIEPVLYAQTSKTQHLQLCVGLKVKGRAHVTEEEVEYSQFKDTHSSTVSTCLRLDKVVDKWRAVVTPPLSANHRTCSALTTGGEIFDKCIVMELVSDGIVDYVNITFPLSMWEGQSSEGLVVAVQAWLQAVPTLDSQTALMTIRPVEVVLVVREVVDRLIPAQDMTSFKQDELVLVMCRWSEDIDWIQRQPYRVIIYEKKLNQNKHHNKHSVSRNIGGEASAFLKFIIDYYDFLPARMLFLHSHRWAYHQEDIAILLANIPSVSSKHEYCNINRVAWGHKEDKEQCWLKHHWDNSCDSEEKGGGWLKHWLGDLPPPSLPSSHKGEEWGGPHLVERCCAQFLVSRELILSRPISFYRHTLAQIYARVQDDDSNKTGSSRHYGLLMEWLWHVIFSQHASMLGEDESLSRSFEILGPQGILTADRIMLDRAECVARKRQWVYV